MKDHFWGLGERTANRKHVQKGDLVIFYIARPESAFGGTARLASASFSLSPSDQNKLSHGSEFFTADYGVWLEAIDTWSNTRRVADLAASLDFIENPAQWWTYLQGGIRQVSEADYSRIVSGSPQSDAPQSDVTAAHSLFALEAHLEEFIDHNWSKIGWGTDLKLYQEGEQSGRQYPAGTWSIDFLAVDKKSNDLVVIELKRGQTSDATVGQILRYMSWVRENIAAPSQQVRGIIVASGVDEALRYAAKGIPALEVQTYSLSFTLQPVIL